MVFPNYFHYYLFCLFKPYFLRSSIKADTNADSKEKMDSIAEQDLHHKNAKSTEKLWRLGL